MTDSAAYVFFLLYVSTTEETSAFRLIFWSQWEDDEGQVSKVSPGTNHLRKIPVFFFFLTSLLTSYFPLHYHFNFSKSL